MHCVNWGRAPSIENPSRQWLSYYSLFFTAKDAKARKEIIDSLLQLGSLLALAISGFCPFFVLSGFPLRNFAYFAVKSLYKI